MSPASFRATYRLQLTPSFGFAAARALIPYLRDLGVSHLYLSPSLQARPGSTHGYDVIDPTRISDELGGEGELRALATAAHEAGLGLVLDVVPNHMATDEHNRFWSDPQLRERFFDIDPVTGQHRRFFDIDDLAGVRQEEQEVFDVTHGLVLSLVRDGIVDGLRIDHPDGMTNPAQYLERLRASGVEYVWIEKILEADEHLRDWPVTGTVGYEFLNDVCAVFVDSSAESAFTALWHELSGESDDFHAVALQAKIEQARTTFSAELERLARVLEGDAVGEGELVGNEVGEGEDLPRAVASMPVYRTYVEPHTGFVTAEDRAAIAAAHMPEQFAQMLALEHPAAPEFVIRFQQTSPPVVAKGVEDTAFYRYARLVALCDVGGDPGRFGISVADFHARCSERARRFPMAMLTTCTHDTKRSADVRSRIAALSWIPAAWEDHVRRWLEMTEPLRSERGAPDGLERYFLFQTLVGAWPIELERVQRYMEKALREAKRNTNWVAQNHEWESDVLEFCRALYSHREFRADFEPFVDQLTRLGDRIALGTVALKLTAPGVPDIYQGDELPFRALVDPDNRRPVDWRWSQAMLSRLHGGSPPDRHTAKLWLTARLLQLRIRRPEAFAGGYEPVDAGPGCVTYLRGGEVLVVVATRAGSPPGQLGDIGGRWRDVLRGERWRLDPRTSLEDLLGRRGVAVLERSGG